MASIRECHCECSAGPMATPEKPGFAQRNPTPVRKSAPSTNTVTLTGRRRYFTSVSSLNIGRYIEMMITPTMQPTPIIISGSMIEVSDWIAASTSSS